MKTADEMFEKLGYKKKGKEGKGCYIEYIKKEKSIDEEYVISFVMKTVMATLYKGLLRKPLALEVSELEAINEKCKELGWVE